ncbi:branched-chain amino acid ABC transporter permease [Jatrophihabitans cynanchi]|jgi:branched-chain amino acid transport system permease protein|uniref:Branched-chain amino acid ABC transporter permease n=1 Tax=Jatrophihabitans cynanchi TaxID=2944128 RepID=A0ABY7JYW3_9ACTN|nr:branched-chain amino acid ABC transporter permease [Jatrophihabitans sp. SB3-54]WAX56507.1 branched-chain amino acid ABC transporter permease [Jatrophihabitans sp. SB3-54]
MRTLRDSTLLRHLLLLVIGVVLVIAMTATFSDYHNYELAQLGAYVCAAAGLTFLTGGNGQVSLGHAALMAIGGYTVALLQTRFSDHGVSGPWVLPVSLLVGMLVTAAAGALFGIAAARLRGPYLAGATLALGVALPGITSHYSGFFKGDQGLFVPFDGPPSGLGTGFTLQHWQAWISLFAALIVLFLLANLNRSAVGRHMRAVRDEEIASALCGLSVPRVQILAFAVSAAAAGLGGGVFAVWLQTASPGSFDLVLSLTLLSAVVIGGLGSLAGAVWGCLLVVYLGTFISDRVDDLGLSAASTAKLHDNLPSAVYGLLLIVVILALPGGIQGLLRRLLALRPRRGTSQPTRSTTQPTGGLS